MLQYQVSKPLIELFYQQAKQKIECEGWGRDGRNTQIKIDNFVHCWITEEAFKQILIQNRKWFRYRGLYFGDASGAGADFTVKIQQKEISLGLRSIAPESIEKWKTVAYPDDRFQSEKEKIADYHIVCNHADGFSRFFGIISKEEMLNELENSPRLYSKNNQEYFRIIPLEKFSLDNLNNFIESLDNA